MTNRPTLFDGDYDSLTNKPSIFDGDYDNLTNKPSIFDGDYNSLTNQPTIFDGEYSSLNNVPTLYTDTDARNAIFPLSSANTGLLLTNGGIDKFLSTKLRAKFFRQLVYESPLLNDVI